MYLISQLIVLHIASYVLSLSLCISNYSKCRARQVLALNSLIFTGNYSNTRRIEEMFCYVRLTRVFLPCVIRSLSLLIVREKTLVRGNPGLIHSVSCSVRDLYGLS